jgi:histidinol phosphatase-like enzyme (inositol monophosphatase family)
MKKSQPYSEELRFALSIAQKAGLIQHSGFCTTHTIAEKDDRSPVTEIDTECETVIRAAIEKRFANDGYIGEESGTRQGTTGRQWVVDPLDGTRPYIRGIPTYSVLIALLENHCPVLGVIHLPSLNRTYYAAHGEGAFCNDTPIHVSSTREIGTVFGSALGFIQHADAGEGQALLSFMQQWSYCYGFMDAFSYGAVASGALDICVNLLDNVWDCAAAACIVSEAGGEYSDIHGNRSVENGSIILSNGFVHGNALTYFKETFRAGSPET